MMRRDLLQKQGETIFRHRGYMPVFIIPIMLFVLQDSEWIELRFGDMVDDVYDWLCLGVSMAGIAFRVATVGFLPRRTSGRNKRKGQVADELNTTGMYSIVRHPQIGRAHV
jgi:protein-S-isoprenylcysteine O-methyltransferase Ste14